MKLGLVLIDGPPMMNITPPVYGAFALVLLTLLPTKANGQPSNLTLENLYSNGAFYEKGFGPVRWMKDGHSFVPLLAGCRAPALKLVEIGDALAIRSDTAPVDADLLPELPSA